MAADGAAPSGPVCSWAVPGTLIQCGLGGTRAGTLPAAASALALVRPGWACTALLEPRLPCSKRVGSALTQGPGSRALLPQRPPLPSPAEGWHHLFCSPLHTPRGTLWASFHL